MCLKKVEQLQNEATKLAEELQAQKSLNVDLEQSLTNQVQTLEFQIKSVSTYIPIILLLFLYQSCARISNQSLSEDVKKSSFL